MTACDRCGTHGCEVCWSNAAGANVCLPCHVFSAPDEHRGGRDEVDRWDAERHDGDRRQPDMIDRVLARLETVGLPVIGAGIPNVAGSRCPLCADGMAVRFRDSGVGLECVAGCPEPDIGAAIAKGAGDDSAPRGPRRGAHA